jgi:hypothetical protein
VSKFRKQRKLERRRIFQRCNVGYSNAVPKAVKYHLAGVYELKGAAYYRRYKNSAYAAYCVMWSRRMRELAGKFLP